MIKSIIANKGQFIKYFTTGAAAFFLDVISLFVLREYYGFGAVRAVMLNQIFILTVVFLVNKYWSFGAKSKNVNEVGKYLVVVAINYIFAIAWMYSLNNLLGINYLLTRFLNICLAVTWNFFLYRNWVYKE